jgi:hypothetical protein
MFRRRFWHSGINMADIYHRRKALTQLLRRELPEKFMIVQNPDHPLLIRGPDILLTTSQTIMAIFMPLAAERRAYGLLKSRLTLSRLALPTHTRCILVFETKDHNIAKHFANDFADVLEWSSRSNVISIASDSGFVGRHRDVPPEIIGDAQTNFANAMTVMRLGARLTANPLSAAFDERFIDKRSSIRSVIRRGSRRPIIDRKTFSKDHEGVAFAELSDFDVDTPTVRDLVYDQIEHTYSLDNGVPYATSEPSGIAVVRDWPTRTRDSEKLILAAAFGGWAFVLEEIRDRLPRFADRLQQRRMSL